FQLFVDLNMTNRNQIVEIDGIEVKPRDVLLKVLEPFVELGEQDDVVLLRVQVAGEKDGKHVTFTYNMSTYRDRLNDITAMARATASTISIVAQMIANGEIEKRGVFPPEKVVPGKEYIEQLLERGITIMEEIS